MLGPYSAYIFTTTSLILRLTYIFVVVVARLVLRLT